MRYWCVNNAVGSSKLIFISNSLFRVSIGSFVRQDLLALIKHVKKRRPPLTMAVILLVIGVISISITL
jgi:hypothetical protein